MKIKNVEYKRLFSLPEYNNETIGLVADVESEKPEEAIAKLYDIVIGTNKTIRKLRELSIELYRLNEDGCFDSIPGVSREIERCKKNIRNKKEDLENAEDELRKLELQRDIEMHMESLSESEAKYQSLLAKEKRLSKHYDLIKSDFEKGKLYEEIYKGGR